MISNRPWKNLWRLTAMLCMLCMLSCKINMMETATQGKVFQKSDFLGRWAWHSADSSYSEAFFFTDSTAEFVRVSTSKQPVELPKQKAIFIAFFESWGISGDTLSLLNYLENTDSLAALYFKFRFPADSTVALFYDSTNVWSVYDSVNVWREYLKQ
jgi:hypothetical protein